MKRDLSEAQFIAKAKSLGFTPTGFMGYWTLANGKTSVCRFNAGDRRRDQLAYLKRENARVLSYLTSPV